MTAPPPVSVILPARDAEPFLAEALHSILGQSMGDFELIVVDDGSTDRTPEILAAVADPRLRVHRNPVGLGVAMAANIALALARGEWIARMDADDVALPHRLRTQLEFLRARPDLTVCGGEIEVFGISQGVTEGPREDGEIKANFLLALGNIMNPTAMLRRAFVAERQIRWNPALSTAEDLDFWIRCMRAGARFANIPEVLLRYRFHGGNASITNDPHATLGAIRRGLIADFFPALTAADAFDLAELFRPRHRFLLPRLCRGIAAALKARDDRHTYFGESRPRLSAILDQRIAAAEKEIRDGVRGGA